MRLLAFFALAVFRRLVQSRSTARARRTWRSSATRSCRARSAYQPIVHQQGGRWIAYVGHHGGKAHEPAHRARGGQRHLDRRRHRSARAALPRAHSRRAGRGRSRRRADGARVQRRRPAEGGQVEGLPAAQLRQPGARDLGRHQRRRSPRASPWSSTSSRTRTRAGGSATPASPTSSPGVEGWRTRRMTQVYDLSDPAQPVLHPQLRPGRPAARRDRRRCRPSCTARSPPARRATASTSATAPTSPACCRSSTARSCSPGRTSRRRRTCSRRRSAASTSPSTNGAHTALPVLGMELAEFAKDKGADRRDFVVRRRRVARQRMPEPRQMVFVVDITDEKKPVGVATFNVPENIRAATSAPRRALRLAFLEREPAADVRAASTSSSPGSTPACARSTSAIRTIRARSATTSRPPPTRPTSAASRTPPASAARWRSRPTTSRSTTAATSTSSTAPTPACTSCEFKR